MTTSDPPPLSEPAILELASSIETLGLQVATLNGRIGKGEQRMVTLGVLGAIIILLIVFVVLLGSQVRSQALCQGRQNDTFRNASIQGRNAANSQGDQQIAQLDQQIAQLDAQLGLFATVDNPNSTLVQRQNATTSYVKSVADTKSRDLALEAAIVNAKQKRTDNPLPTGNCS